MSQDPNNREGFGARAPEQDEIGSVYHRPVMVDMVVELMRPITTGVVVDATFGGGGHTAALRQELGTEVEVIAIDRDPMARAHGLDNPALTSVKVLAGNFGDLADLVSSVGITSITGILFDLGVSSRQLDDVDRGFSFRHDGPLDMRMDSTEGKTAAQLIDETDVKELAAIIRRFGEEQMARRIAEAIVAARPIRSTQVLAEIVAAAMPARQRSGRGHPARKTFQALRIAVNDELKAITSGLDQAIELLEPGGRCVVISYHSLEDRIVKRRFVAGATGCVCPPDLPVCACGATPELRLLVKGARRPEDGEVAMNRRARSARLRAVEKARVA